MAQVVAAFGSSHSTMLVSSVEHWQEMFDRVDRRAPINDFDGVPRTFDELLKTLPPDAAAKVAAGAQAERHRATMEAMDRLERDIDASGVDVLVIIGDDQRELFKDAFRPAIAIYYGDTIRNAAAPAEPATDWYLQDQRKRMEDKEDRHYPCHPALATALIEGLVARDFDITAMAALTGDQFEGHAYSFIHRRFMPKGADPDRAGDPEHLLSAQSAEPAALLRTWRRHSRTGRSFPAKHPRRHSGLRRAQPLPRQRGARSRRRKGPEAQGLCGAESAAAQQACERFIRDQKLGRDRGRGAAPEPGLDHLCAGLQVAGADRRGPVLRLLALSDRRGRCPHTVIASAAKQSSAAGDCGETVLDCFVASLLAMTNGK